MPVKASNESYEYFESAFDRPKKLAFAFLPWRTHNNITIFL